METNNFVKTAILAVIAIIVVASIVTPILANVQYTETEHNEPTYYAGPVRSGTYTVTENGFAINGEAFEFPALHTLILSSTTAIIRLSAAQLAVIDFEGGTYNPNATVTIDAAANTWSAGLNTGSLGTNARMVSTDPSDEGFFDNTEFTIDRKNTIMSYVSYFNITIEGASAGVLAVVSGTIDNLTVDGLMLFQSQTFVDTTGATAVIPEEYLTEGPRHFTVANDAKIRVTFTYNGNEYTADNVRYHDIVAPIDYPTVKEGPVTSMIGIVPVLLMASLIAAIVMVFVARRQ